MKLDEKRETIAAQLLQGAVEAGYRGEDLVLGVARVAAAEIELLLRLVDQLRAPPAPRKPFDLTNLGGKK